MAAQYTDRARKQSFWQFVTFAWDDIENLRFIYHNVCFFISEVRLMFYDIHLIQIFKSSPVLAHPVTYSKICTKTIRTIPQAWKGALATPWKNCKVFLCSKICCIQSSLCIILRKCCQLLSLDPAGGLSSFRPPHCLPLEKILRASMIGLWSDKHFVTHWRHSK